MTSSFRAVVLSLLLASAPAMNLAADDVPKGYHPKVEVTAETRLDWVFPNANQSIAKPPADWTAGYESAKQSFELFVPKSYTPKKAWPLVLFVSPSDKAMGWTHWQQACEKQGVIFAGPHEAGNNCPGPRRIRIVMDVFDEVRRKYNIDADRTYIGGFSGGGRIACAIAFAAPEYFGGVIPICAAGDLRPEPWLRQRVIDRLSVYHITGDTDFNRGEVERYRGPILSDVCVRSKVAVIAKMGHSVPTGVRLVEVLKWLDDGAKDRDALAGKWPASRIEGSAAPTREEWAKSLAAEAKERLEKPETLYSGLMQLSGVRVRWPETAEAREATRILTDYDGRAEKPWEKDDLAEQRRFLIARARHTDAYASGPLSDNYKAQRGSMLSAAIKLWEQVIDDGSDEKAVAEARERIPKLTEQLGKEK